MNKPSGFSIEWGTKWGEPLEYRYARGRVLDPEGKPLGVVEVFDFGFSVDPIVYLTYRAGGRVEKRMFSLPREVDLDNYLRPVLAEG